MSSLIIKPLEEPNMQNSMQAAVGRTTKSFWEDLLVPILENADVNHPMPAYVVAEKLGEKDVTKISVALVGLHRYGRVDRVEYSDPASKQTRWGYFLPVGSTKPLFKDGQRRQGSHHAVTSTKKHKGEILSVIPATYNIRIGSKNHSLTEGEARELYYALAKRFGQI